MNPEKLPEKIKIEKENKLFLSEEETAELFEKKLEEFMVEGFKKLKTHKEEVEFAEEMKFRGITLLHEKEEELKKIDQINLSEPEKKKISDQIRLISMQYSILLRKYLELEKIIKERYVHRKNYGLDYDDWFK